MSGDSEPEGLPAMASHAEESLFLRSVSSWLKEALKGKIGDGNTETASALALGDLLNYLKSYWNLVGQEQSQLTLMRQIRYYSTYKPEEMRQFVNIWVGSWLKKWKTRVEIVDAEEEALEEEVEDQDEELDVWPLLNKRGEMIDIVVQSLINSGEVCATTLIARKIIQEEISSFIRLRDIKGEERAVAEVESHILEIVSRVLKGVRELSFREGPLVYLRKRWT